MKKLYWVFLLLFLVGVASACKMENRPTAESSPYDPPRPKFSTPVTIEELRAAFYRYSVAEIVNALHENGEANWNFVFEKVASGDSDWIYAFTTFVAPGADASAATGVIVALAYALPNNPTAVLYLEIRSTGPSLYNVCTLPFIEPEYAFIKDYGEKTLAALRRVDDPYLLDSRDVCIRRLQENLDYCDRVYREGKWKF